MLLMRRSALAVFATAMLSPALVAPTAVATPVSPWTTPVDLGVAGHSNQLPKASMGAAGDVTTVVRDTAGSGELLAQSHPAHGSWGATTMLSDPAKAVGGTYAVATSPADDAAVAIWGQNTPTTMPGFPGMTIPGPNQIYVASRAAGGAWGTATALSPDPSTSAAGAPVLDMRDCTKTGPMRLTRMFTICVAMISRRSLWVLISAAYLCSALGK